MLWRGVSRIVGTVRGFGYGCCLLGVEIGYVLLFIANSIVNYARNVLRPFDILLNAVAMHV